jgi:hypothetical protein
VAGALVVVRAWEYSHGHTTALSRELACLTHFSDVLLRPEITALWAQLGSLFHPSLVAAPADMGPQRVEAFFETARLLWVSEEEFCGNLAANMYAESERREEEGEEPAPACCERMSEDWVAPPAADGMDKSRAMEAAIAAGLQLLIGRAHAWIEGGGDRQAARVIAACLEALQSWESAYQAVRVSIQEAGHLRWEFDRRAMFEPGRSETIEVLRMYQEMG